MTRVFTKTTAGQQEIETRARRLPPRVRTLLILIDGKRSDTELAAMAPEFEANLAVLLDGGLVEQVAAAAPPVPPTPASPAPPKPPVDAGPASRPPSSGPSLAQQRRDAARAVNDLLGPLGDALAIRIEEAGNAAELNAALQRCVSFIASTRGQRAAEEFGSRFLKPGA